ncbi:rhomboid family intramembrane serine protease [Tenacibaculum finnmarkense]|nr:rhomboid family intramembrane serine protease [Tenacibaculum finnmarkense]
MAVCRSANHIGASGLIYGLAAFLITNGLLERKLIPLLVSLGVAILYGGLIWGLVPSLKSHISWEGHLFGAVAWYCYFFFIDKKTTVIKVNYFDKVRKIILIIFE